MPTAVTHHANCWLLKMLTPKFTLSQDSNFVYVHINVAYIKLSETECYVHDDEFYFFSHPYYLRLHFPGEIRDDSSAASEYDSDTGNLTVRVSKATKGEIFEGLDMLTKLLTPKVVTKSTEIEVISVSDEKTVESSCNTEEADDNDSEWDWFIEQTVDETLNPLNEGPKYGFADRKSNLLNALTTELRDMIELKDPDNVLPHERQILRQQYEKEHFNCEHYLADLFDDEIIQNVISPEYPELTGIPGEVTMLSDSEREKLLQLPRREYIIDSSQLRGISLGLVDLMFAYAYDFRFRHGEQNVESDWTICKLSATLSWLDSFENVKSVLVSCARRSLIFPLYRNWKLFQRILCDVRTMFSVGQSQLLKCLLDIHTILSHSDVHYPLNELYITDYCVWIQSADPKMLETLAKALDTVEITKSDLGLELDEMEEDARKLINEQSDDDEEKCDVDRLANAVSDVVKITQSEDCDSDDEDSDTDTSDSDSSGSSDSDSDCAGENDETDSGLRKTSHGSEGDTLPSGTGEHIM